MHIPNEMPQWVMEVLLVVGSVWWYFSPKRRLQLQAERDEKFVAWLNRDLPEPPRKIDWVAYENFVEDELRLHGDPSLASYEREVERMPDGKVMRHSEVCPHNAGSARILHADGQVSYRCNGCGAVTKNVGDDRAARRAARNKRIREEKKIAKNLCIHDDTEEVVWADGGRSRMCMNCGDQLHYSPPVRFIAEDAPYPPLPRKRDLQALAQPWVVHDRFGRRR